MAKRRTTDEPDYAAIGAGVRLKELQAEIAKILKRFPALMDEVPLPRGAKKKTRKARTFTAAQKKEQAERMKKLWAERKRASKKAE